VNVLRDARDRARRRSGWTFHAPGKRPRGGGTKPLPDVARPDEGGSVLRQASSQGQWDSWNKRPRRRDPQRSIVKSPNRYYVGAEDLDALRTLDQRAGLTAESVAHRRKWWYYRAGPPGLGSRNGAGRGYSLARTLGWTQPISIRPMVSSMGKSWVVVAGKGLTGGRWQTIRRSGSRPYVCYSDSVGHAESPPDSGRWAGC